ncbi:DUF1285 domain-containing protein [Gluconacetobacter liquefaciens]|uniref:DUF1285 domain-containing protein n=2 Tax=Gluconacetobacter liquefaciens TaxID=89584 RepID=A0A370G9D9_GLULI|nr:DUF1285 domain-containing protein [Gluconacetobacter liquefaciens]RDI39609.1 hypothetical protein C7453_102403 [Gluconacetobacter liquefaciens]
MQLADDLNRRAVAAFDGAQCSSRPGIPPMSASCGALPFRIQRDGTWLYRGTPIRRKPMVCLFASVLTRDAEGAYWLQTPTERGTIEVEDAPFVAMELHWSGCGRKQVLSFRTNVDLVVCAGPDHAIVAEWDVPCEECGTGPVPYLHVRDGAGAYPIQARIARSVYYELAALAVPGTCRGAPCLGVWSQNVFFPLSCLPAGDGS